MGERLQPSFILAMTFVGLSLLLIGLSSSIHGMITSRSDTPDGFETIGFEYNFWNPTEGYYVTTADVDPDEGPIFVDKDASYQIWQHYDSGDSHYYAFSIPYGEGPGVRVWTFRNSSDYDPASGEWDEWAVDYFLLTRHTQDWPYPNIRKCVIPFETVLGQMIDNNRSIVSGYLGKLNCTLFINSTGDLATALYANEGYTIRIGTGLGEQLQATSVWLILGQLLTMRLPDCHWAVQAMLVIPFWASMGFIAVTLILRAIPFVGD